MKRRGFTLLEVLMSILFLGFFIPWILVETTQGTFKNAETQATTSATFLSHELMEDIKRLRFDQNVAPPYSITLGPESGEIPSIYNDVDDYHGWSESSVPRFAGYTRTAVVTYIYAGDLTMPVNATTSYKRITVSTAPPRGPTVTLTSLVIGKP